LLRVSATNPSGFTGGHDPHVGPAGHPDVPDDVARRHDARTFVAVHLPEHQHDPLRRGIALAVGPDGPPRHGTADQPALLAGVARDIEASGTPVDAASVGRVAAGLAA